MHRYIQVTTTTETRQDAQRLATALVEQRLAACVQVVGPVTSTYWWEGEVQVADEWQCLVKSTAARFPQVCDAILDLHPYEVPEVIAVPIVDGSEAYLAWLEAEVGERGEG